MNLEKNWIFCLIIEIIYHTILIIILFVLSSSILFYIIYILLLEIYRIAIQHKPLPSQLYRMSLGLYNGVIVKKCTYKFPLTSFFREWIILNTEDNKQIKIYIAEPATGETRKNINLIKIGDFGTLHYRKGKKHLYFEEFVPDTDENQDNP